MDNFKFKKKFGQNFLKDERVVDKIVSVCDITKNDLVIEVGPGRGILTKKLSKVSKTVVAYEIDSDLFPHLENLASDFGNINFIFDDFMSRNISKDIGNYSYDNIYFVSNVPYYITTPILMKLIDADISFKKIVMMVQKEVGDRFSASEGSRDYGSISVFLNYYYDVKKEFLVSRNEFVPVPNVDSVVVSFSKKENKTKVNNKDVFHKLVRDSFKFKRKTIRNNLNNYDLKTIEDVLVSNGFSLSSRAEQLPVEVFVEMSNRIS